MRFQLLLLQTVEGLDRTMETATDTAATAVNQSLLDIIFKSGTVGIIIMLIQLILSFIAVYIFVERYGAINRASRIDEHFMNNIRVNVQSGNIQSARALCQTTDTPVARMVEKGLQRIGTGKEPVYLG